MTLRQARACWKASAIARLLTSRAASPAQKPDETQNLGHSLRGCRQHVLIQPGIPLDNPGSVLHRQVLDKTSNSR